ncbi:hypothetical protein [Helicobacter pylori]|uniref:hypothetical protein n=1 Tax=Helicobacter pylori TaxID=210 RepID=UPI000EAE1678|nr:hypothetical protein [Helicobacter pylori]
MQTLKNKAFRVSIQWNALVRKPLALARGGFTRTIYAKKGYKSYYRIHRELERMMGIVEFHFIDKENVKKEVLTFTSYNQMIETLKQKIREAREKKIKDNKDD